MGVSKICHDDARFRRRLTIYSYAFLNCITICVFSLFPDSPGFSFAAWFGYAFPQMVILLFVAWMWIQFLFLGFK